MALLVFEMGGLDRKQPVRTAPFIAKQSVAVSGTSAASTAFTLGTGLVTVCAGEDCHVAFGAAPTATTADFPLLADEKADFFVTPGHKVAVIQAA